MSPIGASASRQRETVRALRALARDTSPGPGSGLLLGIALTGAVALSASATARAEWLFDVDAGARYETNVTRAEEHPDVRADTAATLNVSASSFFAISGSDSVTLGVNAGAEGWNRFHGLNTASIGVAASYKHKFGVGYSVPWLSLAISAARDDSRSAIRDSDRYAARAELGQRFNETLDAAAGVAYDRRDARNDLPVVPGISGRVFDVRGRSAYARAGYALNEQLQLGASVAVRRGDVVSTTRQNLAIFLASDAIAADPAFGADFFAYRLRGTTRSAALAASWALSNTSSLNLRFADERTRGYDDLSYRGRVTELSLAYSF